MRKNGLPIKIIYFLMIAIPLVVIPYFFIYDNISQRKIAEINKNLIVTKTAAMFVDQEMNEMLEQLKKTAQMKAFRELDKDGMRESISLFHSDKYHLSVVNADGTAIISYHKGKFEKDYKVIDKKYLNQALKGKSFITGEHKFPLGGEYVIGLYTPITDDTGKVLAVLEAHIENTYFKNYLDSVKIGSGRVSLIDGTGFFIYDKTVDNSNKLVPSRCFEDGKGQEVSITERLGIETGKMTIFTKVRLPDTGWYLVASQPSAEIAAPGIEMVTKNMLTGILLIIILLLLWQCKAAYEHKNKLVERQNAEKLALVGELAAGMAHEIRNPLTAIKGFSDLLSSREKYKDDKEIFDLLASSVDHIEGIVKETLLLAKPQKMEISDIDLQSLTEETCNFMRNEALLRDVNLEFKKGSRPLLVKGDKLQLKQVLINIIKNALEASPRGGYVKVSVESDGSRAKLVVQDDGPGIEPEILDKIGTPFFTTKPEGTGLGISVCKRVIAEHDGSMQILSSPGKGTRVEIYLPFIN